MHIVYLGQRGCWEAICHFRNEKGHGAEMRPAIVSGIVTGNAKVSYWPVLLLVPSNSPRSLYELGPIIFNWCQPVRRNLRKLMHSLRK